MVTTRGSAERVPIERVGDGQTVSGTAAVDRDDVSREITGVRDYRDDEGRPLSRLEGTRFIVKLNTGEVPTVG